MANITINEINSQISDASSLTDGSLFIVYEGGVTSKMRLDVLTNYLRTALGISNLESRIDSLENPTSQPVEP